MRDPASSATEPKQTHPQCALKPLTFDLVCYLYTCSRFTRQNQRTTQASQLASVRVGFLP